MNMVEPRQFAGLRGMLALDAPLAPHTTWRAGGRADAAYVPADRDDLALFLRQLPIFESVTVLGLGSNTLVRDGGVRGVVVLLHNPGGGLAGAPQTASLPRPGSALRLATATRRARGLGSCWHAGLRRSHSTYRTPAACSAILPTIMRRASSRMRA